MAALRCRWFRAWGRSPFAPGSFTAAMTKAVHNPYSRIFRQRGDFRNGSGPDGPGCSIIRSYPSPQRPPSPVPSAGWKPVRPTGSGAGPPKSGRGSGDAGSGSGATSRRPPTPSRTGLYFSILIGTSPTLPAPAGSYSLRGGRFGHGGLTGQPGFRRLEGSDPD